MSLINEAKGRITDARNVLIRRRRQTNDAAERDTIDEAIGSLNDTLGLLQGAALLGAAALVVQATDHFEKVVRSASLAPFDAYLHELESAIEGICKLLDSGEIGERLDHTPEDSPAEPAASPPAEPVVPLPPHDMPGPTIKPDLPSIRIETHFDGLASEYEAWFDAMEIRPQFRDKAEWYVQQLLKYEDRYRALSSNVNGVPWAMIGAIHAMECGFNFSGHLHNGDPLTGKTKRHPKGMPKSGTPPFTWEASAIDAITLEGLNRYADWSLPRMLFLLEKYNGLGYRKRGMPTPYLWSFSTLYERGKYVSDGRFDPDAVSKQCGAAVMLRLLTDKGKKLT